ncbi:hypothetical protein [Botrimarina mediterranea]|uniref:Uncharacterized protein n=1 Tax=Botrimarina mediterranea TaxID=2528022 RepID=A0A518K605_9BACT|nr:hypothetical protein [Botrimarina mediterranea]QDV73226.1 hypothetical protein Spa11_14220 [Botrimarina mediterranea]
MPLNYAADQPKVPEPDSRRVTVESAPAVSDDGTGSDVASGGDLAAEILAIEARLVAGIEAYGHGDPRRGEALARRRILMPTVIVNAAERYGQLLLHSAEEGRTELPLRFHDRGPVSAWFPLALGLAHLIDHRARTLGRRSKSVTPAIAGAAASCDAAKEGEQHA